LENANALAFGDESAAQIGGGLKTAATNSTSDSTPNSNPAENLRHQEFLQRHS
jgi:hypothetical protein